MSQFKIDSMKTSLKGKGEKNKDYQLVTRILYAENVSFGRSWTRVILVFSDNLSFLPTFASNIISIKI